MEKIVSRVQHFADYVRLTGVVSSAGGEWVSDVAGQTLADGDAAAHLAVGVVSARTLAGADAAVVAAGAVVGALVVGSAVAATALAVRVAGVSGQARAHGTAAHVAALGVGTACTARLTGVDLDALQHDALLGLGTALDQRISQLQNSIIYRHLGQATWAEFNCVVSKSIKIKCYIRVLNFVSRRIKQNSKIILYAVRVFTSGLNTCVMLSGGRINLFSTQGYLLFA